MRKLNVAFCIPDMIVGGVETVFISTLEELLRRDEFNISVFMRSKLEESFYLDWFKQHPQVKLVNTCPLIPFFENMKKYTKVFPLENIRKIIFSLYKRYKRHKLRFGDVDVFIDYKNCSFSRELAGTRKPKIAWFHGSYDCFMEEKIATRLNNYDKLVVLTDEIKATIVEKFPEYNNKIVRIYNPINQSKIEKCLAVAPSISGKYFLSVARLGAPKDLRTVIYAFGDFFERENKPNINLVIVGDGPARKKLEEQASHSVAKNNIIFTGTETNPFGYMRDAIAHIFSSNSEGFGMVLIESAMVGTLNISSKHKNGPAEILLDGQAGLLFEVGDIISLSRIMSDIYHNRVPHQEIIKKSKESLVRFSADKIGAEISSLIKGTTTHEQ